MMNKSVVSSIIIVSVSTLFIIAFFSGGIVVLDNLARSQKVAAHYSLTFSHHSLKQEFDRFIDVENINLFNEQEEIKIAFAGDVMMEGSIERAMNKHGFDYPFLQVRDELQQVDYAIVNLETAVTKRGVPQQKQFNFRTGKNSIVALKDAGFQMVSLANNHAMDFGEIGLLDTIDYLNKVGLAHIGAGRNSEEAYAAEVIEIKGKQIAILGFSRVLPTVEWYATPYKPGIASGYQLDRMVRIIKEVKNEVDYVFVFMHWGVERKQMPEPYQFHYAKAMIDAGADGIIGAHPHVIQGLDYYKGKPIAYSLGNFLFPDYVNGLTAESAVLTLIIRQDEIVMKFSPYKITGNQVAVVSETVKKERLEALEKLSFNVIRDGDLFFSPE